MTVFHIGYDGVPRECSAASPSSCPLRLAQGEKSPHFSTYQDASQWYESHKEEQWSPLYTSSFTVAHDLTEEDFGGLHVDYDGSIKEPGELTFAEEQAVGELMETEKQITIHQREVAQGTKPSALFSKVDISGLSFVNADMRGFRLAFLNGDYDRARAIHAQAVRDTYDYDGTMYMTVDELIRSAQEKVNYYD